MAVIDLDAPEALPPRLSARPLLAALAVTALLAASAITYAANLPGPPATVVDPAPAWTASLDPELGEALVARVSGPVVLVAAHNGMAALDRATGGELWRRTWDVNELNGLGIWYVEQNISVRDGVVIWDRGVTFSLDVEVIDLASGVTRYHLERAHRPQEAAWMSLVGDVLAVADCVWEGDTGCVLEGYELATGELAWRHETPGATTVYLPETVDGLRQTGRRLDAANDFPTIPVDPGRGIALVEGADGAHSVIDLAGGTVLGGWNRPMVNLFIVGDALLSGAGGRLARLDPATGATLWDTAVHGDYGGRSRSEGIGFADGLLVDEYNTAGASHVEDLVDLATGETHPVGAGDMLVADRGVLVDIDRDAGTLRATDRASGAERWTAALVDGAVIVERYAVQDGLLVIGGMTGRRPAEGRRVWTVNVATGAVGGFRDGSMPIGLADGVLITAAGDLVSLRRTR
ncbi:hypothetical protein Afil01_25010 [Actinorhabdospora filicis]|uniref:Pyrrolo-quinoline quinone repeat domain-containing protein n=1 Tax=Actinorhabdospora filicis TaxID=1785913 RepID=A0A9W6SL47_9ACTN|nr:PQQ-binding-like beta-propeller repeat protein [Actinorhabdospora filicis]GLZ77694.1 hypothetical protein Afil01_25010 [Actinorhabdospora filicis]